MISSSALTAKSETDCVPPTLTKLLWSGWAASVLNVVVAMIAIEAAPHVRGIGFFPVLRYAITMPLCVLVGMAGAFLYSTFQHRLSRPRRTLALVLHGLATVVLLGLGVLGHRGLALAALPAMLAVALATSAFSPYFVHERRRFLFVKIGIVIVGLLQFVALIGALSTERVTRSDASDFEIPRKIFAADQNFLNLPNGARIHYVDEGKGETILFLHGNPSWSFQWRDLIRELSPSFRCVALDYPGFGMSTAPLGFGFTPEEESRVVEEFVDRLALTNLTLVMQDWGGPIGLALAERRPELVRRVILGSTWAWQTSGSEPRGKFSIVFGGPIGEFIQMNFPGIISAGLQHNVVRKLPSQVIELYTLPFLPPARRGITSFYPGQITRAHDFFVQLELGLPRVADKPALIFWALKDPGFPRTDLVRWQRVFPKQETIEFPDSSHFFFEDERDQMIPAIRAFMTSGGTQESTGQQKGPKV
jgi:pimeloyl-ACP methyl ester carboxylesterase